MTSKARARAIAAAALVIAGCASSGRWFTAGPRPAELTGEWIDAEKTTAADTATWSLGADGDDRTVHRRVVADGAAGTTVVRSDKRYGAWYLSGSLADTVRRALCFKRRPRDGATCFPFRLDTLPGAPMRRQLTVRGYQGAHHTSARVLAERVPR